MRYLPITALYQLTVLPVADFASGFNARLVQIPAYLRGARAHLRDMPELVPMGWWESALAPVVEGVGYLHGLRQHPRVLQAFGPSSQFHEPKKSIQPRKHTEDTQTQCIPGATIHHLAGDGGTFVKLMIFSV